MYRRFFLSMTSAGMAFFVGAGWADVPPPPVNHTELSVTTLCTTSGEFPPPRATGVAQIETLSTRCTRR